VDRGFVEKYGMVSDNQVLLCINVVVKKHIFTAKKCGSSVPSNTDEITRTTENNAC
jgi:hypothetical protein